MALTDYKGPYRTEAFIAEVADACRLIGNEPGSHLVSLETILTELEAHGVESIARVPWIRTKGRLKIEIIEDSLFEFLAYVSYSPTLTLTCQKSVWTRFKAGHSYERTIIAHEIGHIMMHHDDPKHFSPVNQGRINFAEKEYSTEWQADTFAYHLLIALTTVEAIKDVERVAFACNVPTLFAYNRVSAICKADKSNGMELCPACGYFSLDQKWDRLICKCGYDNYK